jgi:hypothetical protein
MRTEVKTFLKILGSQVGVQEEKGNHGPKVDMYHRAAHLKNPQPPRVGEPWCMSLMAYGAQETAKELGVDVPIIRTAGCDVMLIWARRNGILFASNSERADQYDAQISLPEPGDIMLVMAHKYDATHTGGVESVVRAGVGTIEGNTNNDGGREGTHVLRNPLGKPRPVDGRYTWVRWANLLPAEKEVAVVEYGLLVNGRPVIAHGKPVLMPMQGNVRLAPARALGEALGVKVGWDKEIHSVIYNGQPVGGQATSINGESWLPVRVLAAAAGVKPRGVQNSDAHREVSIWL